jgi:hypothetical protein
MATFSSLVNFSTVSFAVGFGAAVKSKKKVKKREQIQAASRKANRVIRKKSVKHYPQCSLEVRKVKLMKAAWVAKVEFYKVKIRPKHVLLEKPILKKRLPALEQPIVAKKEAAKQPALPTIIKALKETRKPYIGKKRNVVGKKYKEPTNKVRKSKSEAKKASGKKCLPANLISPAPSGKLDQLIELTESLGYNIVPNNSIASLGWVNIHKHEIVLNVEGDLVEYVLCHELVHIAVSKGLITPDIDLYKDKLSNFAKKLGNDYWRQVKQDYSKEEKKEERVAAYLMWMPEFVLSLFTSFDKTSSASGEALSQESAEGDISTPVVSIQETDNVTVYKQELANLKANLKAIPEEEDKLSYLMGAVQELGSHMGLDQYDLMWLGLSVDNEESFETLSQSQSRLLNLISVMCAYAEIGSSVFPRDLFSEKIDIFLLDALPNSTQERAIVKYCLEKGVAHKLHRGLYQGSRTVDLQNDTEFVIPEIKEEVLNENKIVAVSYRDFKDAITLEGSSYSWEDYISNVRFDNEEIGEVESKSNAEVNKAATLTLVKVTANINTIAILSAIEKCETPQQLANFVTYFGNFEYKEGLKYQLTPGTGNLTYGHLEVDFENLSITTSRDIYIRNNAFIIGYGEITGSQLLGLLLITITGNKNDSWGQSYLDAYLNNITAAEEEQDLYGQDMASNQQLRVVRENSVAILGCKPYQNKYPFIQLENGNNADGVGAVVDYYVKRKIPFFTDKIATKRVVVGEGVTALYAALDYEKGVLKTILDVSKPGKLFTRAYQTLCIPANQGIMELQPKHFVAHEEAALVLRHHSSSKEPFNIVIKGEAADTITGDANFLINGSGVGLTWKAWCASVLKTLRDSYNAMSLREGETIEDVHNALVCVIESVIEDRKVPQRRRSGDSLLTFRGQEMFSYKGLNQDFVAEKKFGSEYTVRKLGTSQTLAATVSVTYYWTEMEPKLRALGMKAVMKNANKTMAVVTLPDGKIVPVRVLLGAECLKGNASRLMQFAQFCKVLVITKGGSELDSKVYLEGGYHPEAMESYEAPELLLQDDSTWLWTGNRVSERLDDLNSTFYKWWNWATTTYYLEDTMSTYDFLWLLLGRAGLQQEWSGSIFDISQELLDKAMSHEANQRISLLNRENQVVHTLAEANGIRKQKEEDKSIPAYVRVREEFQGVRSQMVYQMELASIRECSNRGQASTIQQTASVYACNSNNGEVLANGTYVKARDRKTGKPTEYGHKTVDQEQAILGLVAMSQNDLTVRAIGNNYEIGGKLTPITLQDIATWNGSLFNLGCNAIYPKNEDPYLAFYDASVTKKFKPSILVNKVGITDKEAGDTSYSVIQAVRGSARNYTINVGTGYNVASIASCMAALARYKYNEACDNKEPKEVVQELVKELKLWGWVNCLAWKTLYENAWLASYNEKGEQLAEMLHDYRKGCVMEGKTLIKSSDECAKDLRKLLCKVEGISEDKISLEWVTKLLWCYRIARAISRVEKGGKDPIKAVKKNFGLGDEDIKYLAICGAFRRCDQGRHANREELVVTDGLEYQGISMWSLLRTYWEEATEILPSWLERKLFKAMQVHSLISGQAKAIAQLSDTFTSYGVDASNYFRNEEYNQVVVKGKQELTAIYPYLGVPTINYQYATSDSTRPVKLPYKHKDGYYLFDEVMASENAGSIQGGAFQTYVNYCPLRKVVDENSPTGFSFVRDDKTLGGKKFKGGIWAYSRPLTAKEILQYAQLRYPQGVFIVGEETNNNNYELYVNFGDVLSTGAFTKSGAATGMALNLATFLKKMSAPIFDSNGKKRDEAKFKKYGRNAIAGIQGQLRESQKAGLLKKLGKTAPTKQSLKVLCSHSNPYLITKWGIVPVFFLHPNDEIVKEGKYKTGDFVSISRTPMIAKCYGVLVLSTSVTIGHLDVAGLMFALSNRGDGDGDPVDINKENGSISKDALVELLGEDAISYLKIKFPKEKKVNQSSQ